MEKYNINLNTCVNYYKNKCFTVATESDEKILPAKAKAADCNRRSQNKTFSTKRNTKNIQTATVTWQIKVKPTAMTGFRLKEINSMKIK